MEPTTIAASVGVWAWNKYGKTISDRAGSAFKTRWDKFTWTHAADVYCEKVKKLYGTMQIMGMAKPVPLDDIFTEAYLLDKPTAIGRFNITRLKEIFAADADAPPPNAVRVGGLTLVKRSNNLFILGKPGAGKTTFLKYIALKAAERLIDKVPIFVSLKQWADSGVDLMPFIAERFEICDFPAAQPFVEELLKSGNAIVLFDGLDEVNHERGGRDRQTRAMNNFVEKYDRTQCLITCRNAASDYSFQPFTYVEIADFTVKQIQTFVGNWFRDKEGGKDEETRDRFLVELAKDDNKGLHELARTPLLLTLLCLTFDATLRFPQRRVEIYEEALDALLKKWDASRRIKRDEVYRKLSLGHKENMLARIAAETFDQNEYFISQSELEKRITDYVKNVPPHDTSGDADGQVILKAIEAQHGIFVERAHRVYSFSHLTFQEYFTAKYIVDNASKGTLKALVKKHCVDRRWREVFLLTTSLLPDASEFIAIFKHEVDELFGNDEKLRALLTWGDRRASCVNVRPWLARESYLYIALRYPSRGLVGDLNVAHDRAFQMDLYLVHALVVSRGIPYTLGNAHQRSRNHARDGIRALTNDFAHARKIADALNLNSLAKELAALAIPTYRDHYSRWKKFGDKFRALINKHRDIGHEWNFGEAQETRLTNYLKVTRLLQDCLELATISPDEKHEILNDLYLPPAPTSES